MFNTVLSPARRRQLGVYGAFLLAGALAACDKTEATAPLMKPTDAPSKLAKGAIPPTVITLKMVDEKNNVVKFPGAYFEVFGPLGIHKYVDDNGTDDSDESFGVVKLVGLVNGLYKI